MDGHRGASWEEITRSVTEALAGDGRVWQAIEGKIDSPDEIRRTVDGRSPVWAVPICRITPRPRRSILDYAEVRWAGCHPTSRGRAVPGRPARDPPEPPDDPQPVAWITDVEGSTQRELLHTVGQDDAAGYGGDVVRGAFASMRDEILLDLEGEVRRRLASTQTADGLAYELHLRNTRERGSDGAVPLSARHILDAGRNIVEGCPQVPFPRGLFCMVSPAQAVQLLLEGAIDARRMSVCGIDVVVSPLAGKGAEAEVCGAMVAARGSVCVELGMANVRIDPLPRACRFAIQYSMGAAITPRMSARIVTERGAADLAVYR